MSGALIGMVEALGKFEEDMAKTNFARGLISAFNATGRIIAVKIGDHYAEGGSATSIGAATWAFIKAISPLMKALLAGSTPPP